MGIVSTIPEKCRRCYTCVRECPAKAIKVVSGEANVIRDRCIACGNCVKVCAQKAKWIRDDIPDVEGLLAGSQPVFACLAPSFPAAFVRVRPGQVIAAVRRLGFAEVWEVAFGAELVSRAYGRLFEAAQRDGRRVIATPCPAIVAYIEKFMPALHDALAPVVSPMMAVARAIRRTRGGRVRIVFIGPCIAKKNEIRDPSVAGVVDHVLTFEELTRMLEARGIDPADLADEDFTGPRARLGGSFPISGGLLKTSGLSPDILQNDIVITEGKDRVLDTLNEVAKGEAKARFFDVLFCEGCISGPMMMNDLSVIARKERIADYVNARIAAADRGDGGLAAFADLDLDRGFTPQNLVLPEPAPEAIAAALRSMKKVTLEDQLNCGACGYRTCREKAIAVCQGLAEPQMCLPYLVGELEATVDRLAQSHKELASAQERLVQTERLASMGQLSAGVAHELNNPLASILMYSHLLLRELKADEAHRADLQMIVSEATRSREIVRGLLNFARQSRVSKAPTDLAALLDEVLAIMAPKAAEHGARLARHIEGDLPPVLIDAGQVRQMLVNLVANGIDAVQARGADGAVCVRAVRRPGASTVEIHVTDNGCGISPENLSKLFTPFFTTKALGKGTGLGLAIAYGVVKMHAGDIAVESELGKGTTFKVVLPIGEAAPEAQSHGTASQERR